MKPLAELYTLSDRIFFDAPEVGGETFAEASAPVPPGWERERNGPWVVLRPPGVELPDQGWKVHVSATPDNAAELVALVVRWALAHATTVKFLSGPALVLAHNLKYAPRPSGGKVLALYPCDDDELRRVLTGLQDEVGGRPGPRVLTDLRWEDGPLYVRYGGFRSRWCTAPDGERVLAIARPDGTLVPDERRPVFTLPEWVEPPEFLREALDRRSVADTAVDWCVTEALHFSNGGGVYLAHRPDRAGAGVQEVVLKEGRPHAGLSRSGADAVARLDHEAAMLRLLDGLDGVPQLVDVFTTAGHRFLAMTRVPGRTLQAWMALHHPLIGPGGSAADRARYTERALDLRDRVADLVARLHARGVVFGDLHPANVLVDDGPDGVRVGLVDFENASPVADGRRQEMGHAGFVALGKAGAEVDRHALAVLTLWLFLPLTSLLALAPDKLDPLVDVARELFDLPSGLVADIRSGARPAATTPSPVSAPPGPVDWSVGLDSLVDAIAASATPWRTDRLFPGDIEAFRTGGAGFAHGAAGVLWAQLVHGGPVDPDHEDWLRARARGPMLGGPGLGDGAHGVAHVLDLLGHTGEAMDLVRRAAPEVDRAGDLTWLGGLAGIGLNQLHLAQRHDEPASLAAAVRSGERVAAALASGGPCGIDRPPGALGRARDAGTHGGLLRGWSGPCLLFLGLLDATGDDRWARAASRALGRDLDLCVGAADGTLQVDGGFRTLPYLEVGSAGIALAADALLARTDDDRARTALDALSAACDSEFVAEPNLFFGRAGLLAVSARLAQSARANVDTAKVMGHLARMEWHSLAFHGHVSFPGDGCSRLSMDMGTGNAGVLCAIGSALDVKRPFLPLLVDQDPR
ncbi:class III lanthionine synthetase LanKC [Pseudonocardia alni]|uniref:class III lanthionine synthetase LanKC n=1 Tax=Pseudonocardia alni TaxID=33907 RepID=UPI00331AB9D7